MNIGQLMKGLLGDVQAGDGKALELKVGQIVRGVFIQMLDNQDALIQINGTQVRARLETQVLPGQTTLLQVQPQSLGGMLVLKTVDQQAIMQPEEGLREWIKSSGLPDQKWTHELVRDVHRDGGAAMTRETAVQFQQAAAAMPAGGDVRIWMQAAALAFKRGLPMTGATIGALQQVMSGAPAHALLEALEQGLAAWSGGGSAGSAADEAAPPGAAQAAAAKLQALLAEGAALMRAAQAGRSRPPQARTALPWAAPRARSARPAAALAQPLRRRREQQAMPLLL
ncbi:hypothetical protein KZ483_18155 [Paenibacillus sp. sptzw28]|uniref:hypothetical protein n=1 Tax=Paenibacillus sp. sptzw28 TaxID=715179 RepID=UPI001C6E29D1|nr:hypothetical protein [Paenibacillus sp. sptzw28]QYR19795.1 hypothetical protein KZ483_18155 [Paenibacillus sp. sptzw28]